ncbi:MAG: undecaprenyl-diphosphatase UppP [Chloroflexi bacterium]|nr:undecaprenyl-diphosphatase UppP [Chloroflexota bacterium]
MSALQAVVLGLVQGLTEFIPVSSSAHLIIVPWLLGWPDPGLTFDVALHLGTLAALLAYFWGDWVNLLAGFLESLAGRGRVRHQSQRLLWFIIVGSVPGGIAGVLGDKYIERFFHQPGSTHQATPMLAIAGLVAALGLALWAGERYARHRRPLADLTWKDTVLIGLAQALALLPGVSRSGSTITAGLLLGLRREAAARFSFLLATPIVAGAGLKKLLDVIRDGSSAPPALATAVGFLVAAASGYLCIKYLLLYLQRRTVYVFVYYRLALGALLIVLSLALLIE